MVNDLLIEFINEEKLNALELIDALYHKEKYNLSTNQINNIKLQINEKIEESDNKVELLKIKEKLIQYNMDTTLVDRIIKRQENITNEDIQNLDYIEVEYYINDGFNKLTLEQKIFLYKKSLQLKFNQSDLDEIIEQINDEIEIIDNKDELIKIKNLLLNHNIDTTFVNKIIKRFNKIEDIDINDFDEQEIEYYIYEGLEKLSLKQQILLLEKAKRMNFDKDDIDYLIESINEYKKDKKIQKIENTNKKEIYSDYEEYQFEEEELEEDDFYFEDPD